MKKRKFKSFTHDFDQSAKRGLKFKPKIFFEIKNQFVIREHFRKKISDFHFEKFLNDHFVTEKSTMFDFKNLYSGQTVITFSTGLKMIR